VSIVASSATPTAVIREATTYAAVVGLCDANGHARTGVRWEVYDHWRDDPDSFETAVYWQLAG
jgi:hypothetical protein